MLACNHKASILFICLLQNITFYYFLYITLPDNFFSHEIHGRNEVMIQRCTNSDIEYWPVKYYLMVYWKPTPLKFCMLTITRQNIVTAEMSCYLRCFHFHKWIWIHIASRRTSLCLRQTKQEVCSRPSFRKRLMYCIYIQYIFSIRYAKYVRFVYDAQSYCRYLHSL